MATARKRQPDPKARWTKDRHRLLTIHDGTRLTPAVLAVLAALVQHAADTAAELVPDGSPLSYERRRHLDELTPRLVARSDGLALYVTDRRLG